MYLLLYLFHAQNKILCLIKRVSKVITDRLFLSWWSHISFKTFPLQSLSKEMMILFWLYIIVITFLVKYSCHISYSFFSCRYWNIYAPNWDIFCSFFLKIVGGGADGPGVDPDPSVCLICGVLIFDIRYLICEMLKTFMLMEEIVLFQQI